MKLKGVPIKRSFRQLCLTSVMAMFAAAIFAQGIKFEEGISWEAAKKKARKENKFIFLDCYTTWCGPCRYLKEKIFTQAEIGDYFNSHFINVSIQMDQSNREDGKNKDSYADAASLESMYSISAYPTLLFFSPDGNVVHRVVGVPGKDDKSLIAEAIKAINGKNGYYECIEKAKASNADSLTLMTGLNMALKSYDDYDISLLGDKMVRSMSGKLIDRRSLDLIVKVTKKYTDDGFHFLLEKADIYDSILYNNTGELLARLTIMACNDFVDSSLNNPGFQINAAKDLAVLQSRYPKLASQLPGYFKNVLKNKLTQKYIRPRIYKDSSFSDWSTLLLQLQNQVTGINVKKLILQEEALYHLKKKEWIQCATSGYELLNKYGDVLTTAEINNICWEYIFLHSSDSVKLQECVKWLEVIVLKEPDQYNNLDTYANVLYKLGYVDKAVDMEKKAIDVITEKYRGEDKKSLTEFQNTIIKMRALQKTWLDESPVLGTGGYSRLN